MKRRIAPALVTLLIVFGCAALGVWQLERREWKMGLITERAAALAALPVAPPQTLAEARALDFHRVVADGSFLPDKEILLHAIGPKGAAGFNVLTPLREASGRVIVVNRGFVPSAERLTHTFGAVRIEGLLRLPPENKPGWFTPDNHPRAGDWYWIDLPAMAASAGLKDAAPFYINSDATPAALANDHLQYAVTWFLLAAAAVVIYVLSQRRTARGDDGRLPGT